jgi:predicted dehydrogenase
MTKTIRVGIIGASAEGGWARESHVPAVQGLDGLEFAAVATNSKRTADKAAAAFGVEKAYGSGLDLIRDPEIDLVTIATRVPDHRDLVMAALAAGKHVYCEWPLGRGIAEAEEMALKARSAGVHTAIGLQLRSSPFTQRARNLVSSGAVGRLLGVNIYSATPGFGPNIAASLSYLEDPANFANLITIQAAHTIDLALALTGTLEHFTALLTTQYPMIRVGENAPRQRTTFDHILMQGKAASGTTLSIEVAGGRPLETPFRFDLFGEHGALRIVGGAARGVQAGRLKLSLNDLEEVVDEGEISRMPDGAANVAATYVALRNDITSGTSTVVGFDHAVSLIRLVEDLFMSSHEGRRKMDSNWPIS